MPRYSRNSLKTKFFHVITQGINKSYIFDRSEDIKKYIKIMYEIKKEYNIEIIAYCIMNNHTHMLLKIEEINDLSKYMQKLNSKYALYYNKKYDRVGYVFRDRFKSEGIYDDRHLNACVNYIYNNPVKASICERPEDYPYSNYHKNKYQYMYKDNTNEDFNFIDFSEKKEDKQEICKYIIDNFLKENKVNIDSLKKDKLQLKRLFHILINKYKIPLRKIESEIRLSRETIRKMVK